MGTNLSARRRSTIPQRRAPRRAVVLAAGKGSRLWPQTRTCPKPLLTLQGRPLVDWTLSALQAVGVTEAALIVHYLAGQIIDYCGDGERWSMKLAYRWQSQLTGTATALQCASDYLDRAVWVVAADYALRPAGLLELKELYEHSAASAVVSLKHLSRAEMAARSQVLTGERGRIKQIVEKPSLALAADGWGASLIYILPPAVAGYLENVRHEAEGERHLASAVNALLVRGHELRGVRQAAPGEWTEADPNAGPCVDPHSTAN